MNITYHAEKRIKQRGITKLEMLDKVLKGENVEWWKKD